MLMPLWLHAASNSCACLRRQGEAIGADICPLLSNRYVMNIL